MSAGVCVCVRASVRASVRAYACVGVRVCCVCVGVCMCECARVRYIVRMYMCLSACVGVAKLYTYTISSRQKI